MPNQKRVSLRLIARQAIDGWTVEVVKDGTIVQRGVPVRDPLSPDQRSTCRWYLEQYVECLPFSVDRAEEAELLLESYPEDLLRQLSLREVLASDFKDAPSTWIRFCYPSRFVTAAMREGAQSTPSTDYFGNRWKTQSSGATQDWRSSSSDLYRHLTVTGHRRSTGWTVGNNPMAHSHSMCSW
jgi:hypothetical protein